MLMTISMLMLHSGEAYGVAQTDMTRGSAIDDLITGSCDTDTTSLHKIELGEIPFSCNKYRTPREEVFHSMAERIDSLANAGELCRIYVTGGASPEGPMSHNIALARKRAKYAADWITSNTLASPESVSLTSFVHSWNETRRLAIEAGMKHHGFSETDFDRKPRRLILWLDANIFPEQRATKVSVIAIDGSKKDYIAYEDNTEPVEVETIEPEEIEEEEPIIETYDPASETWIRNLRIKTNIPAWLCLWTNIHAEIDLAPHFSFSLPIYYSGFNYFTRSLKFRTFGMQPEFRWFPRSDNTGFFAGAHFGFFYYNIALDGDWRYQDHDGNTPALGGGLAAGYRWRLGKKGSSHWEMEASIGGGIYSLDYDVFHNKRNGLLDRRCKRTFFGIDQAAVSIIYRFGVGKRINSQVRKKGGEQ